MGFVSSRDVSGDLYCISIIEDKRRHYFGIVTHQGLLTAEECGGD